MGRTGLLKQIINRQSVFALMAAFTMMLPVFLPAFVSAAPISGHSITPSTPSINAPAGSVQYEVRFTPAANAAAFVIDFCTNSSLIGQGCDAPAGMDLSGSDITTGGFTKSTATTAKDNLIVVGATLTASTPVTFTIEDVTNPTDEGAVYARIVTYGALADAQGYVSTNPSVVESPVDNGSVAMYFNTDISVSGTVLETMTFCVAGGEVPLTANCANLGSLDDPTIELGEDEGGVTALRANAVSSGVLQTQINTNAAGGVVIRLKSSADCGGLKLAGSPAGEGCHIAAAGGAGDGSNIVAGEARFGVMPAVAVPLAGATGTYLPFSVDPENPSPYYLTDRYSFNYDSGSPTTNGVTSTFGDPFLYTANAPATGQNMQIEFGASIADDTPAGAYSTNLSMIAVGKF